ncbi:MAG TPA: GNAT family protein [Candidatus Tumulicola sp.]|nr:GNAT family protein [Candidatus Tumulicola sp.]
MRPPSPRKAAPTWLVGKMIRLRPLEPGDVRMLQRWVNTSPARDFIFTRLPLSREQEQEWLARAASDPKTPTYIIQTLRGKDIGVTGLVIDGARATLGISIFERSYWNKGCGTDAVRTLIDGAFRALPLVRIELTVLVDNARAIACYERAGFAREGVLRRLVYRDGKPTDMLLMSALHEEWLARAGR